MVYTTYNWQYSEDISLLVYTTDNWQYRDCKLVYTLDSWQYSKALFLLVYTTDNWHYKDSLHRYIELTANNAGNGSICVHMQPTADSRGNVSFGVNWCKLLNVSIGLHYWQLTVQGMSLLVYTTDSWQYKECLYWCTPLTAERMSILMYTTDHWYYRNASIVYITDSWQYRDCFYWSAYL